MSGVLLTDEHCIPPSRAIWSRPMPLGWYFAEQWRRFEGNNWIQQKCDNWISNDRSVFCCQV